MSCTVSTSAGKRLYTVSFVSHAGHVPPAIYAAVNVSISLLYSGESSDFKYIVQMEI